MALYRFVMLNFIKDLTTKAVLAVCPKHLKDHSKRERSREANQITDSKLSPQLTLRNIQDTTLNLKHQ